MLSAPWLLTHHLNEINALECWLWCGLMQQAHLDVLLPVVGIQAPSWLPVQADTGVGAILKLGFDHARIQIFVAYRIVETVAGAELQGCCRCG